jgi:tetratricopeptide (TPR) repeat protein
MASDRSANQPAPVPPGPGSIAISPSLRKRLQRCFERGKEVLRQEKPDRDYAHTMFSECVLNDPGNLEYVEAMLDNLQRKYNNNKRGARLKGFGGRGAFKKAVQSEDWDEVFQQGLDLLRTNPWDVATLRALAQACQARHHNEVELRYLKNALDVNRKDIDVNRHCAESLTRMGQFDQAIACWHRIEELDKGNDEARRKISELTLAKARGLPALETTAPSAAAAKAKPAAAPAGPARPAPAIESAPKPSAAAAPPEQDAGNLTVEQLEQAVARDEANLDLYVQLAGAYTQQGRLRDAYQVLKRALAASGGNNLSIREQMEDAQLRMIRAQVAVAEKRAATEKTEEAADLARRFRVELNRQELMVLSSRCDRYPQDLTLRYELGTRLKRESNFREALQAFDAARGEPALRAAATLELGECYQQLKQYSNALKCYQAAVSAATAHSETHKLALYRAAVLATALKSIDLAREMFTQLIQLDPHYRDAAARLDKLA